jgi:hypothetical protein
LKTAVEQISRGLTKTAVERYAKAGKVYLKTFRTLEEIKEYVQMMVFNTSFRLSDLKNTRRYFQANSEVAVK